MFPESTAITRPGSENLTLHKPEIHFIRDTEVAVPDLSGWRRERMPQVPDGHRFEVVPDWVCEILSPSTARKDRFIKLPLYAKYGVAHAWLVDPEAHTLEAYELRDGFWTLIATLQDDAPVRVAPFDAVEFSLADLWSGSGGENSVSRYDYRPTGLIACLQGGVSGGLTLLSPRWNTSSNYHSVSMNMLFEPDLSGHSCP